SNEEALGWVTDAIQEAGLQPGVDVALAIDVASTHFFESAPHSYVLAREHRELSSTDMVEMLAGWAGQYPVVSIEDGLAEDDWAGWQALTARLGGQLQLVGDDLFTTDIQRVSRGIDAGAANAVLVKVNQIGTLSEALQVVAKAREV